MLKRIYASVVIDEKNVSEKNVRKRSPKAPPFSLIISGGNSFPKRLAPLFNLQPTYKN